MGVRDVAAQSSTTGAIGGIVKDKESGDTLAGVTVVATSPNLQGSSAEITDGKGAYKIDNLPPGIYTVSFYYSDVQIDRPGVQVQLTRVTRVDQTIDLTENKGEVIVVDDKAPTIDVTRTDQGITVDKDYLKHIPVPGRTFESALGAAAGSAGDGAGVGFSGSTSLENSYVVDGVNTTSLNFGTVGTPLINEFIEEIQVITGGYQAEFGRATGAVVNVVTKSGTNEFHGSVFSTITPYVRDREELFQATSAIDADFNTDFVADFGVELGGPIVKDKVWFYVGFAPRFGQTDVTRRVKTRRDCQAVMDDGTLTACDEDMYADGLPDEDPETGFLIFEEIDKDSFKTQAQSYQFVSKVNYALAPEHQGSLSILGTPTSGEGIFTVVGNAEAFKADFTNLNTDVAAKWTSKFNDNKTQVEALFGWHRDKYDQDAIDQSLNDVPGIRVYLSNLGEYGRAGGERQSVIDACKDGTVNDPYPRIENCPIYEYWLDSPGFIIDNLEDRKSGQIKATQRADLAGHHEFKAGADIENNTTVDVRDLNTGKIYLHIPAFPQNRTIRYVRPLGENDVRDVCGCVLDSAGDCVTDPLTGEVELENCEYLDHSTVKGQTINWAAFAQDSWSVQPNLTLNYGVRYEEQRLRYADHLQNTIDPFSQEPLGTNAIKLRGMWAPRVGAIYDWTKEGRSKVYSSYGRYYESIPMSINDFSFSGDAIYSAYWRFDQCTDTRAQWQDPDLLAAHPGNCPDQVSAMNLPGDGGDYYGGITLVTPGTKAQFMDEAIAGVEYEVLEDLRLGLSYKRRGLGRVLEDVSIDAAQTYIVGNPGPDGYDEDAESELIAEIAAECPPDGSMDPESAECQRLTTRLEQFQGVRRFDKPRRDYNALELTAVKRFSRNFFVQGSYVYSRTEGNYPGLFSIDNGQGMPNISTQYDLIELLPNRDGLLPQDRPHYFKFDGYYTWDLEKYGLATAGMRYRAFSGTPVDVLGQAYNARYFGSSESYLLPRGSFGRTEFVTGTDLHFSYGRQLARGYQLDAFVDIFNLFNQEQTFAVDETYTFDPANPVVGGSYEDLVYAKAPTYNTGVETADPITRNLNFNNTAGRYAPQSIRFGLRLSF